MPSVKPPVHEPGKIRSGHTCTMGNDRSGTGFWLAVMMKLGGFDPGALEAQRAETVIAWVGAKRRPRKPGIPSAGFEKPQRGETTRRGEVRPGLKVGLNLPQIDKNPVRSGCMTGKRPRIRGVASNRAGPWQVPGRRRAQPALPKSVQAKIRSGPRA
jgi:hypothetical protein